MSAWESSLVCVSLSSCSDTRDWTVNFCTTLTPRGATRYFASQVRSPLLLVADLCRARAWLVLFPWSTFLSTNCNWSSSVLDICNTSTFIVWLISTFEDPHFRFSAWTLAAPPFHSLLPPPPPEEKSRFKINSLNPFFWSWENVSYSYGS